MVNLLLTMACGLDCPYCFAAADPASPLFLEMTLDEVGQVVSRLTPATDQVRLLGGEPTLHSRYPEILGFLKAGGFQVVVFTNGLQPVLRSTVPIWPDRILLNLNAESFYQSDQLVQIRKNLSTLSDRTSLAFNIFEPDFDLTFHRSLIQAFDLLPIIRLGIAQPILGGSNVFLPDSDMAAAHQSVVRWARLLARDGIRLHLDCGFVRCLFTDADLEVLVRAGTVLNFQCAPVMDVTPGLKVWRCYAFSGQESVSWYDFEDLNEIRTWFERSFRALSPGCEVCGSYQRGWCRGGCLSRNYRQHSETTLHVN